MIHDDTTVMPEFFFHISLELFADSQSTEKQADKCRLAWPSGIEALSPFLSIKERGSPRTKRQTATSRKSSHASVEPNSKEKPQKNLGGLVIPISDESQTRSFPASRTAPDDKRLGHIYIESTSTFAKDSKLTKMNADNHINKGIGTSANGLQTKGRYEPLDQQVTDSVWGVVHLYRDAQETPDLYGDALLSKPSNPWYSRAPKDNKSTFHPPAADQDCTTLCILAVPSYLAPSDFLGFIGEESREQVSHFRMIRTARANRYMVLIKFRDGKLARNWQKAWNGRVFNSMEVPWPLLSCPFHGSTDESLAGDMSCCLCQICRDYCHHDILS